MYAGRFGLKTILFAEKIGGTIMLTDEIANYPGFSMISGYDLAEKIRQHALEYGLKEVPARVAAVERKGSCFRLRSGKDGKDMVQAKTVIMATGTEWRKLDVPGEEKFTGRGVHYCALCDGAFYRDKTVAIIGGSDSAAKEALLLAQFAKKVYIIYRGEKIRPEPINERKVEAQENITVINNTHVTAIQGESKVMHVDLDTPYEGSDSLALDGVFVAIGHIALSDLAKQVGVTLNGKGEIGIDRQARTNVPGVFAAGDVADTNFKQAITGAAEGVTAAYGAYTYLNEQDIICACNDEDC
ncbi:hypothetical protein AUJ68_00955 [Candidatus Woesearchaeota archaeon CG1_02_57_44]|nr:MAG: hypothetical protein AUJ68_00955 [Candidatus Woesearchaeota archaeon CG1_02_57_44]